jgi:hypothetical protein
MKRGPARWLIDFVNPLVKIKNHKAYNFDIRYVTLTSGHLQRLFTKWLKGQKGPSQGAPQFNIKINREVLKNHLVEIHKV